MIAPMHMLAVICNPEKPEISTSELLRMITETRQCLNGKKTEKEASQISDNLLQYSKKTWPTIYKTDKKGKCKQEDAAEFLLRVLTANKKLEKEVETIATHKITCSNKYCSLMKQEFKATEHINIINDVKGGKEINLQTIVDKISYSERIDKCVKCKSRATKTKEIIKAPQKLLIQVERVLENGSKINTDIRCPDRKLFITANGIKLRYKVRGVIIHLGDGTKNGHYVCNYYDEEKLAWVQIDDDNISKFDMREQNIKGTVYILEKEKDQSETITENQPHKPVVNTGTTTHNYAGKKSYAKIVENENQEHKTDKSKQSLSYKSENKPARTIAEILEEASSILQEASGKKTRNLPIDKEVAEVSPTCWYEETTTFQNNMYIDDNTKEKDKKLEDKMKSQTISISDDELEPREDLNQDGEEVHDENDTQEGEEVHDDDDTEDDKQHIEEMKSPAISTPEDLRLNDDLREEVAEVSPNCWCGETIIFHNSLYSDDDTEDTENTQSEANFTEKGESDILEKETPFPQNGYQVTRSNTAEGDYATKDEDVVEKKRDSRRCWYFLNASCHFGNRCKYSHIPTVREQQLNKDNIQHSYQQKDEKKHTEESTSTTGTIVEERSRNHSKRYYVDRDDPGNRKLCWWHNSKKCIYGVNCWYIDEEYTDHQHDYNPQRQPFLVEAQQA